MELKLVHYSSEGRGFLRRFIKRVEKFCIIYDSEADLNVLFEEITESYYSNNPRLLCFAVVEGDEIVSHAMFTIEQYFGKSRINMNQYWKNDNIKVPYSIKELVFREVIQWGQQIGIDDIRILARNEEVASLFENVYGFNRSEKVIMNASLKDVADRIAELPDNEEKEEAWAVAATAEQVQHPIPSHQN